MNYQFKWSVLWTGAVRPVAAQRAHHHARAVGARVAARRRARDPVRRAPHGAVPAAARARHLLRRVLPQRPAAGLDVLLVLRRCRRSCPRASRSGSSATGSSSGRRCSRSGVYSGARFSEVLRSGIQSIPRTQLEASVASGLTTFQAYRYVILPVALRLIIPPGTNESLNLLKNSSVALTISVAELTFQTRQIETYTAKAIEALTAGTAHLPGPLRLHRLRSWPGSSGAPPSPASSWAGGSGAEPCSISASSGATSTFLIAPGLPRHRQLRGRHAAPGHPGHRPGLRPRHLHRPRAAGAPVVDPRAGDGLRRVLPGRPAGHGDLLDLVRHARSCSRRRSPSSGWR